VATTSPDRSEHLLVTLVGALLTLAVTAALVPLRDTIGGANVALILLSVVTLVGWLGGPVSGAASAATAALAFNYFHTEPYLTLRIDATKDVVTVALLLIMGLVAGTLTDLRRRSARDAHVQRGELLRLSNAIDRMSAARTSDETIAVAVDAIGRELPLDSCRFEVPAPPSSCRVVDWRGGLRTAERVVVHGIVEVPADGLAVPVSHRDQEFGAIVLVPKPHAALDDAQRRFAVAVANVLGSELAAFAHPGPDRV